MNNNTLEAMKAQHEPLDSNQIAALLAHALTCRTVHVEVVYSIGVIEHQSFDLRFPSPGDVAELEIPPGVQKLTLTLGGK